MSTMLSLCAVLAANASGVSVDFEGFSAGDTDPVIATILGQIAITADNNEDFDIAMIFDTANPTGGDTDLATPVTGPVAPGAVSGPYGNVVIISENGSTSNPNDEGAGGVITFDLDFVATFLDVHIIDIEEQGGEVRFFLGAANVGTVPIAAPGDNSLQRLTFDSSRFDKIEFELVGSGAVGDLEIVPTPGTMALGAVGLGTLVRRRRT